MPGSAPESGGRPRGGSWRPLPPRSARPAAHPRPTWGATPLSDEDAANDVCPWLYLHTDPDGRASAVTADHRCEIRPEEVPGPGHQLAYCMTSNYISCPQLQDYQERRYAAAEVARGRQQRGGSPPAAVPVISPQPSLIEGVPRRGRDPLRAHAVSRMAWAAAGAVGAFIFAAGLLFYANPDRAASDPLPEIVPDAAFVTATATPAPTAGAAAPVVVAPALTATPSAIPEVAVPSELPTTYEVQPGDTLVGIASQFSVDPEALVELNQLGADAVIQVGTVLLLPSLEAAPDTATDPASE